jgi:hypothetical protein
MRTYKTTPKLASKLNYMRSQQSDIFSQKGLNKPEIQYKHRKLIPRNTFKSSHNFLEWNDTSPHLNPSIKIKQNPNNLSQILNSNSENYFIKYDLNKIPGRTNKHKSFYEKMYENEPDSKINKANNYLNARYQKETMNLGEYEGNEYKIKKNKSVTYDPSPFLNMKNPLNKKLDLIYGGCDDLIGDYKPAINRNNKLVKSASSIGFARRDFETKNEYDPKIRNNPKEMKYFLIYGNKGIENANKKLKPMTLSRSTNNIYVPGEEPTQNRIKFLRSNIFNDKETDKMNNDNNDLNEKIDYINPENRTIKVNRNLKNKKLGNRTKSANNFGGKNYSTISHNEDLNIKDNYAKRFLYKQNDEKLPNKLDWRDPQCYLLFPQNKNKDILKKNARQRKFKEIYGTDPIMSKEKLCEEFTSNDRPEIDEAAKNNYKDINFSKMKRIAENISQIQGNKFIKENIKNNRNLENKELENNLEGRSYEIKSAKNNKLMTNNELKKQFSNKGMHIYDIRENIGSILNDKKDNKIEFKIRENNKDCNYERKMNNIKKELKDKGMIMKEKLTKKKENTDIIPQTLKWNNPHCGLLTKNKIAVKTNQGITHSKPPLNRKNEEEKITRICVNLKYKTKPYNS